MADPVLCLRCGSEIPSESPPGPCPGCLLKAGFESQPPARPPEPTQSSPPGGSGGFVPPTAEEMSGRLPQLEILELLGRGGMGAVYKARQRLLDRLVAVKVLPPEVCRDSAFAERFAREAQALARLSHTNIVAVYDFGRTVDGLFYFVMEYVDGVNLRQTIQSGGTSTKKALAIVPQICEALQFAHDEGIVHRDIKPENILVDKKGRVKIADFGLAKLLGHSPGVVSLTSTRQVMGTLRYMAPEQMEGTKVVDHRADIYSLGVVFYELLTGELPIGRFAPPSEKVQIDVRLDEVVLRTLETEPERRYQRVGEVRTDIQAIASNDESRVAVPSAETARRAGQPKQAAHRRGRDPVVATLMRHDKSVGEVLVGLRWLLFCVNLAVLVFGVVLGASREYSFSYSYSNYFEYAAKLVIHKYPVAAAMVFASGVLSVGIYSIAASLARAKSARPAEDDWETRLAGKVRVEAVQRAGRDRKLAAGHSRGDTSSSDDARVTQALLAMGALTFLSGVFTLLLLGGVFVSPYHFDLFFRQDGVLIPLLVLQTLAIPIGILIVIGGLSRRPQSSAWSRVGATLGLVPLTPAWLITLPLGFWVLSELHRR